MSRSDDPVDEVERALMQMPYLLAQGIETAARVRVMRAERREHAERAGAEAEVRAAADAARQLQSERDHALPVWQRADDRAWARSAAPIDLFETWAMATAWLEHDRGAAASAQRAEAEMRRRWPGQMRLYDDARTAGLGAPEAMRNMVATAANAGWDPTRAAYPQPAPTPRPALEAGATVRDAGRATNSGHESGRADAQCPLSPFERAMHYLPAIPSLPSHGTSAAVPSRTSPAEPRVPRRR